MRIWIFLLWLLYFIFPYDLLPDFIPGIGRLDDLIVLLVLYWSEKRKNRYSDQHRPGSSRTYERYGHSSSSRNSEDFGNRAGGHSEQRASRPKPDKDPYLILGIGRSAGIDDIKRAYRVQANRYHPDKVAHLGDEFQNLAKEKFQDIQWAYEKILNERGIA